MENKISTRKLLLTVSMALLLVVAVLGFEGAEAGTKDDFRSVGSVYL